MIEVLAAAKTSRDSQMMLKAIARAEAQLRLGAELLGQLRTRVDLTVVRVIRSISDLHDEELQAIMRETEALMPPDERLKLLAPPLGSQ